jgi:1-deoxy-D-xylulose-5-phosphate reductoisomerase
MNNITVLGSTGSIGRNTLMVVSMFPERFAVKAITAKKNIELLADQIKRFKPDIAAVLEEADAIDLKKRLPKDVKTDILYGREGFRAAATHHSVNMVVSAMVGAAGLMPTLDAIDAGKHIALANKETLVMAGEIVMARAKAKKITIRPVDSEHSAIFQCIDGNRSEDVKKIYLTASGGPFRNRPAKDFASITVADALAHPTWQMGKKISIDSATLMNKGLEVIEAKHLFAIPHDRVDVIVHPQSIIHSMVLFKDGAVLAQMGLPDMKVAIAYAMSYPERLCLDLPAPDFAGIGALAFEAPDYKKFPCLGLSRHACQTGGSMPCVLNAANEIAVNAFLKNEILFTQIPEVIDHILSQHPVISHPEIKDILSTDQWARRAAGVRISKIQKESGS